MTTIVRVGDVRQGPGGLPAYVLAVQRGRGGESRTVYVIGYEDGGVIHASETRGHAVREWPLLRRTRLDVRVDHGHHSAVAV